jgi:hypothetical protein
MAQVRADVPDSFVKDTFEVPLGQCRALEVLLRLDFPADLKRLLVLDGLSAHLSHALLGSFVISQIQLGTDEDDRNARSVVFNLGCPLYAREQCAR